MVVKFKEQIGNAICYKSKKAEFRHHCLTETDYIYTDHLNSKTFKNRICKYFSTRDRKKRVLYECFVVSILILLISIIHFMNENWHQFVASLVLFHMPALDYFVYTQIDKYLEEFPKRSKVGLETFFEISGFYGFITKFKKTIKQKCY